MHACKTEQLNVKNKQSKKEEKTGKIESDRERERNQSEEKQQNNGSNWNDQ